MVRKRYFIYTDDLSNINKFIKELKYQGLRYKYQKEIIRDPNSFNAGIRFTFIISPDMVSEVEELIMEIAEKSGVKVE